MIPQFVKNKQKMINLAVNTDFDTIKETGVYTFNGSIPTGNNRPVAITGFLEVFNFGSITIQRYSTYAGDAVYARGFGGGSWFSWRVISLAYKGSTSGDFNNLKTQGIYKDGGVTTIANRPSFWGVLEVIDADGYMIQRMNGSNGIQQRISYDKGATWTAWKTLSFV